jgi:hypothetical protein
MQYHGFDLDLTTQESSSAASNTNKLAPQGRREGYFSISDVGLSCLLPPHTFLVWRVFVVVVFWGTLTTDIVKRRFHIQRFSDLSYLGLCITFSVLLAATASCILNGISQREQGPFGFKQKNSLLGWLIAMMYQTMSSSAIFFIVVYWSLVYSSRPYNGHFFSVLTNGVSKRGSSPFERGIALAFGDITPNCRYGPGVGNDAFNWRYSLMRLCAAVNRRVHC